MRRMRVYVAGPIRKGDRKENIRRLSEVGLALFKAGHAPYIPIVGDVMGEVGGITAGEMDNGVWRESILAADLAWVAASDALVRLPGESEGADGEERVARLLGIPVYYGVEQFLENPPAMGDRRFHAFIQRLGRLHDKKQADYGRDGDPFANVRGSREWGVAPWVGSMIRATDKVKRLQKVARGGTLLNEGVEDSFDDDAVYVLIAKVLWGEEREIEVPEAEYA